MEMPKYDGVIEEWKVDLIVSRAKLLGFRKHELPDAMQEAVLELLRFEYDPDHENRAKESTVLTTVIDNRLRKVRRSAMRYNGHVERASYGVSEFSREEVDERGVDVAGIVAGLTQQEQAVCQGLASGMSRRQIAKQLGCGWHTVDRIMARLREHFREVGLGGWIGE